MRLLKANLLVLFVVFALVSLAPGAANAQGLANATRATFEQAVEVPGHVLPAGTYEFVDKGNSVVQIWDEEQNKLVATLLTNAAEQSKYEDERHEFEFEKPASDKPVELKAWFRGNGIMGREFIYEK